MMVPFLATVEGFIFLVLAVIHFNWAASGKWGFDKALPTNEKGKRVLNPRRRDSFLVGIGLLAFSFIFFVKADLIPIQLPTRVLNFAILLVAAIMLLRAIGDFKYVGFFKKITATEFAKYDSKYYSPLTLFLATVAVLVKLL